MALSSDSIDVGYFATDGGLAYNDWKGKPDGQDYIRAIAGAGRPDVLAWAGDVLYPEVQAVYEDFSKRYGWGSVGQLDFFERGEHRQQGFNQDLEQGQVAADRMELSVGGFGFVQLAGKEVAFAGGNRSANGQGTKGTSRLTFMLMDMERWTPEDQEAGIVGEADLNLVVDPETGELTGDVEGLVNIELKPEVRGSGLGAKFVQAAAANAPDGLRVYDIKKNANHQPHGPVVPEHATRWPLRIE